MKILLSFLFVLLATFGFSQSVLPLRADTVLIEKSQGNGELKIKNSTRDTLGVMVNMGGGKTRFMRFKQINDTTFVVPPYGANDTIRITGGSGGGSSGISGLTLGRIVIPASATTVTDDAGLLYDTTANELTTDSTSVIQHRADYVTLNPVQVVDSVRTFGNSITVGSNASPTLDSGYVYRVGAFLEKPVGNRAIAGTGSVTAISQHYLYTPLLHNDMSLVMVGFNDIRRNNVQGANGYKTLNKIVNAHKSIFFNHFLKSFVAAGSGSVTRYNVGGSWAAPWDARAEGGKTGQGAFTGGLNDSAVYAFTDSTVGVGLIGADTEGSTYSVYIDNSLVFSGTTVGQYDGVNDGFSGNTRAPLCVFFTGLTYAAHSIRVVKTSGSSLLILDYFGHLRDAATAPPLVIMHAPYMNAAGYATAPNASNVVRTDTMNNKLDSLVASFPSAYQPRVFLIETNNCYDTLTGLDVDNIHPNNTGHRQIFNCITASIDADAKPLGSIYFSNETFYGVTSDGAKKFIIGTGTTNYIPKFTASNILGNSLIQDDGTNIGISQTPATYKLGVTGTTRITGATYLATASGSDRVGIGTTGPNFKLEVNGNSNIIGAFSTSGSSSGVTIGPRTSGTGYTLYGGTGELTFFSGTTNSDQIKISADGKFGIFKVPVFGLDVNRTVAFNKDSLPTISVMGPNFLLTVDTGTGQIKKILPADIGLGNGIYGGNGSLPSNVTVTSAVAGRNLNINGISEFADGPLLSVNTTGSVGIAIQGESTDGRGVQGIATSGNGLYGSVTSGYGLFSQATTGSGIYSQTNSGLILEGLLSSAGTNDVLPAESISRSTSGTAAAGFGFSRAMYLQASTGTSRLSNEIITEWTTATDASRVSQLRITGVNAGTTGNKAIFKGSGQFQLPAYGSGTFTGTPAYSLQVDASGNIIEGSLASTAGNWAPTATSITNVASSTVNTGQFSNHEGVVTASISLTVDPTSAGLTEIDLSLPVASTFSNANGASGTANTVGIAGEVIANSGDSRVTIRFNSPDGASITLRVIYQYRVTAP